MQVFLSKHLIFILLLILSVHFGCGTDDDVDMVDSKMPDRSTSSDTGTIIGTVTDINTNLPISDAVVKFLDSEVRTDSDGKFTFAEIPYTDNQKLTVEVKFYETYAKTIVLNQSQLTLSVTLTPLMGTVSGTVRDAQTKNPIPGSVVRLDGKEVSTEADGGFTFFDIPYVAELELTVRDPDYQTYRQKLILDKERLVLQISVTPLEDPSDELNAFLENLSNLLESLDFENILTIQSLFSESYVASDDPVTTFGIASGVIPPNYESVVPTFRNVFEEYSALHFVFKDREMDITHARKAAIELLLEVDSVNAEDEAMRHLEAKCVFEFRREDSDWKIVYWELLNLDIRL